MHFSLWLLLPTSQSRLFLGFDIFDFLSHGLPIHVLMRDEKEGRKKQARSNKHVRVYQPYLISMLHE